MKKKTIGVALGAGSTKGFAHIGVLQVLEENRIPIGCVTGCSIGSIIGAIYAVGSNLHMLEKYAAVMNMREFFDVANPKEGGLLHGEKLEELIRIFTHDKSFDQTNVPFACVATDANRGELVTLNEGKLHTAVRASMSIPGIFTPVHLDGRTLVDGGVLERVPCRLARQLGAELVIGVDVGYHGGLEDASSMNAYQQINRTLEIMGWEIAKGRLEEADVKIVPEVLFVKGRFSTDMAEACVAEGRRAAADALPEILKRMDLAGIPLLPGQNPEDAAQA